MERAGDIHICLYHHKMHLAPPLSSPYQSRYFFPLLPSRASYDPLSYYTIPLGFLNTSSRTANPLELTYSGRQVSSRNRKYLSPALLRSSTKGDSRLNERERALSFAQSIEREQGYLVGSLANARLAKDLKTRGIELHVLSIQLKQHDVSFLALRRLPISFTLLLRGESKQDFICYDLSSASETFMLLAFTPTH